MTPEETAHKLFMTLITSCMSVQEGYQDAAEADIATALSEAEARGRAKALEEVKVAVLFKEDAILEMAKRHQDRNPALYEYCITKMAGTGEAIDAIRALQDKVR